MKVEAEGSGMAFSPGVRDPPKTGSPGFQKEPDLLTRSRLLTYKIKSLYCFKPLSLGTLLKGQ